MTKDYGHEVRFSPEHHILLKYGKNLLKYPESVKKIGNGKLNLLGTLFLVVSSSCAELGTAQPQFVFPI